MRYEDVDWERASCRGVLTDLFYLETNYEAYSVNPELRRMCSQCPILDQCREYAIWNETYGFWAGMTERQRQDIRAKLRRRLRHAA